MLSINKSLIFILLASISAKSSFAQSAYQKGEKDLNIGLHIGWGIGGAASFDYGIAENISLGGNLSISTQNDHGHTYFGFAARAGYHFAQILKFDATVSDPYAGVSFGYRTGNSQSGCAYHGLENSVFGGAYVGYRYTLNKKAGFYAEIGYPLSSFGLTFSL